MSFHCVDCENADHDGPGCILDWRRPSARRLRGLSELARVMGEEVSALSAAERVIVASVKAGGTVYICGNGGSMSQAQHFAAELTGRYKRERRPIAAVALGSNPAHMTAVANDYGYEHVFARELAAFVLDAPPRGVLICLSTSGTSANVVVAEGMAHVMGIPVVFITGANAPEALESSCYVVRIPSTDTAIIQEATLSVLHSICEAIDEEIE